MSIWKLFFSWKGCIDRNDFFWPWLGLSLISLIVTNLVPGVRPLTTACCTATLFGPAAPPAGFASVSLLGLITLQGFSFCFASLSAKRLHDMGRTALWLVVPALPFWAAIAFSVLSSRLPIGALLSGAEYQAPPAGAEWMVFVAPALAVLFWVWLAVWPSRRAPNPFNPMLEVRDVFA